MTTKTPYDAEVREDLPYNSVSMRLAKARREAYLRALADVQPRLDALVEALRVAREVFASRADPEHALHLADVNWRDLYDHTRAALKLAGEPPGS